MRDLMIDIETLGSRPGSVILSIGAVTFDAETGQLGDEFYSAIDPETAVSIGLTTDVATMMWWMKQSEDARRAAFCGERHLAPVLIEFAEFVRSADASRVWAKPPSFDLVLLEAAFRACILPVPWHFRTHRDCRTIFDLTNTKQPDVGTAHNALDDAKGQALGVIAAYSTLGGNLPPQEQPNDGTRRTFVIPDGQYAVLDEDGRATGEVRPLPTPQEPSGGAT
ncbi:3'-5' exonuclease [Rhizobium sp. NFR03]|uniref:3'-5' exonuclease n=1 Tax=Rhizobium sp. NFR03 TaxID=1566263 RepID=UPI0008C82627|nr:3'-5' exonuclease [Rhizobium sp. NFR03]SER58496.1 protein of unknown function [Rhizobium sp. NFR03]